MVLQFCNEWKNYMTAADENEIKVLNSEKGMRAKIWINLQAIRYFVENVKRYRKCANVSNSPPYTLFLFHIITPEFIDFKVNVQFSIWVSLLNSSL